MKPIIIFFISLISICSCTKDKDDQVLTLTINNQSTDEINNLTFYVNTGFVEHSFADSINIDLVEPQKSDIINWEIKSLPKNDGSFVVRYSISNQKNEKEFGYFSNGILVSKEYIITITKDTIMVN